jgi:hypothetical protein
MEFPAARIDELVDLASVGCANMAVRQAVLDTARRLGRIDLQIEPGKALPEQRTEALIALARTAPREAIEAAISEIMAAHPADL